MKNKDLPFCIFFANFTFASRKNKHLREPEDMSNELPITECLQGRMIETNGAD